MARIFILLISCSLIAGVTLQAREKDRSFLNKSAAGLRVVAQAVPVQAANPRDTARHTRDTLIGTGSDRTDTTAKTTDTTAKTTDTATASLPQDTTAKVGGPAGQTDSANGAKGAQVKDVVLKDDQGAQAAQGKDGQAGSQAKATPAAESKSKGEDEDAAAKRELDTRWFISPLLKFQFQDFSFLEVNRKGYLSDAYSLPFFSRGNGSFAASAYKNLSSRISMSADIGVSFGHVTNDEVLISQTKSKRYNLLNAAIYYHLLGPSYGLQPYLTVGINDLINDNSYASVPMGVGVKYNGGKIMAMAQLTYGAAVNKSISNTTMYSMGIYIPIGKKRKKQADQDGSSGAGSKKDDKDKDKDGKGNKNDSTAKNGGVVNNIYITINIDSVLRAKGLLKDDDESADGTTGGGANGRRKRRANGAGPGENGYGNGNGGRYGNGNGGNDDDNYDHEALKPFNLEDFGTNDFKVVNENGHPVIRFVVYFEFNEYSLNSRAFNSIDKVISHVQKVPNMYIEIKGYTDDVGTDQYNNFLSRRRANMVRDYLNSRGIPAELMKAKAYGSDNPVADNRDPNAAWLNRRAEIIVRLK